MWYEIVFRTLSIINYVVLILIALPVLIQVLYILLFFLPKKKYPVSEKKGRIAYLIPAHNEADVIGGTVKAILEEQKYPREKFDVFVVAHNCTDDTAKRARDAGAIVLELNDPDPAHRMALYPLKHGVSHILSLTEDPYDVVIHLDADNHINEEFSSLMNDAFQSGVDFARPYEGSLNGTQNFYTKASGMLYSFDSRFGSRVRERLHLAAHVNGSGAMMSVRMLQKTGGYDCETASDDAEFNLKRMYDGYKGHFVEDAVVYEDMPSSYQDTLARNRRMGSGVMDLFKKNTGRMLLLPHGGFLLFGGVLPLHAEPPERSHRRLGPAVLYLPLSLLRICGLRGSAPHHVPRRVLSGHDLHLSHRCGVYPRGAVHFVRLHTGTHPRHNGLQKDRRKEAAGTLLHRVPVPRISHSLCRHFARGGSLQAEGVAKAQAERSG